MPNPTPAPPKPSAGSTASARLDHPDGTVEVVPLPEAANHVDISSADSFPASDPPSFTSVTHTGKPKRPPTPPRH